MAYLGALMVIRVQRGRWLVLGERSDNLFTGARNGASNCLYICSFHSVIIIHCVRQSQLQAECLEIEQYRLTTTKS
jgi:hypothetical protein